MSGAKLLKRVAEVESEYRKIRYQSLIVDDARKAQGREGDPELTYGTTTARLALKILDLLEPGPEDVFYDLGCGLGVPTNIASLVCKRATGIDVLPQLIGHARQVAETLELSNAKFIVGDLREIDLSDGTVFYSYSTCLSAQTREVIAEAVSKAPPGARIVTVTHWLTHPSLELTRKTSLRWGATSHGVFLHERI
jgi:tRNA/tmRNA/rRNA uracil-C5-methylase (TrmA/RlmC/RlmD family)